MTRGYGRWPDELHERAERSNINVLSYHDYHGLRNRRSSAGLELHDRSGRRHKPEQAVRHRRGGCGGMPES